MCSLHESIFFVVQFMAANTAMQGAYIPQYAHMQTTSVPVEVRVLTEIQPNVCKNPSFSLFLT